MRQNVLPLHKHRTPMTEFFFLFGKLVTIFLLRHNMYCETESSTGEREVSPLTLRRHIMCGFNNLGNNGSCCWIIILILLFCCCGNGSSNNGDCGCGCGNNNNGCGCGC